MGLIFIAAALAAVGGGITLIVALVTARDAETRAARRPIVIGSGVAVVVGLVAGAVVVVLAVTHSLRLRDKPPPEYPSLVAVPDQSLHGTVAYLAHNKTAGKGFEACARVSAVSGAETKDVLCWPSPLGSTLATMVWRPDHRLLVTEFDAPPGKDTLAPKWAKLVDVATGVATAVPDSELGDHARPSSGARTNPAGERLVRSGKDGNVTIELVGPSGSRTVFSVRDANPDWGILTGPAWGPDFAWFMMWDGTRLLLTTVADSTTRIVAEGVDGGVYNYDVPGFSITGRAFPGN